MSARTATPNYPATVRDNMALAVSGPDKNRLTRIFNALAEGGKTKIALARQPWGGEVGWLTDKFGIHWTVTIETSK